MTAATDHLPGPAAYGFDSDTPRGEAVEVRLHSARLLAADDCYIAAAWVDPSGIIRWSLGLGRGNAPLSLDNLQPKLPMPRKAVPGWQAEFIAHVGSGLYQIVEVR